MNQLLFVADLSIAPEFKSVTKIEQTHPPDNDQGHLTTAFNEKRKDYLSNNKEDCKKKRKALIDNLIKLHLESQELSEEDAIEEIVTFIMAGYETVAMSTTWALFLIGLHPDVQEKLHEEIDKVFGDDIDRDATEDDLNQLNYLNCVLMESSRIYPVIPMFGREALEDTIIQRYAWIEIKALMSSILRNFTVESLDSRDKILPIMTVDLSPSTDIRIRIRPRKISKS
ncbi:cytochrome P450 4c3 [Trichonephila inaurata madagascariensis]|uniref:Cytochrome P450 4c3 n=1 Tax=Trichonephila inaurata madagascariensis TaxID=2747483 RepID=A0A8X6YM34_9ARAC|nr:cytochrome P450 4c3 [Trichonephila inaurata madagascariensis]